MKSAQYWIDHLQLKPHPEGGFFREMYRSNEIIPKNALPVRYTGDRNFSTSIYFLLRSEDISAFHKITSDELWFFHAGSSVDVHIIADKEVSVIRFGINLEHGEVPQGTIPKNCWFGAKVTKPNSYALVSCTVAPGFDFEDFELAQRTELIEEYPALKDIILALTHQ